MKVYTLTSSARAQKNTIAADNIIMSCDGNEITLACPIQDKPKTLHVVISREEFNAISKAFAEVDNFMNVLKGASNPNESGSLV